MPPRHANSNRVSMSKSIIVQRPIFSPLEANSAFSSNGDEVPLVLVLRLQPSWCHLYLSVPSGVFVLHQRYHARQGALPSGVKMCWPAFNRISAIVNSASLTYNCPVKGCPSSDNVMVDVDLSLTFQVGPTEAEAELFVYSLGAARFDELLSALTDEAIRGLVHDVPHDQLHDLREEFASGMMRSLNKTLREYGVSILSVKVTDVILPTIIDDTLQEATECMTRMEEMEKKHDHALNLLEDAAAQRLTEIEQRTERQAQDIAAKRANALVMRQQQKVSAGSSAGVAITEAQTQIDVAVIRAESELAATEQQAQRERAELLGNVRAECARRRIEAEQMAANRIVAAEAALAEARSAAAIVQAHAEAERDNSAHLEALRQHEYAGARVEALAQLARSTKLVVAGDAGEAVLGELLSAASSRAAE